MEVAKKRGRPKGTGKDDKQTLLEVARRLTEWPRLRPTTAMRSLGFSEGELRRLQRKWREEGPSLLAAVRRASTSASGKSLRLGDAINGSRVGEALSASPNLGKAIKILAFGAAIQRMNESTRCVYEAIERVTAPMRRVNEVIEGATAPMRRVNEVIEGATAPMRRINEIMRLQIRFD